jgi:hypothetical protein
MAKAATKKTTTKKAPLRKRARNKQGHYIADDPGTPNNEAFGELPVPSMKKYIGIGLALLLIALVVLAS